MQSATASLPPFPGNVFPTLGRGKRMFTQTHTLLCTLTSPDTQVRAHTPQQLHTDLHQCSDMPLVFRTWHVHVSPATWTRFSPPCIHPLTCQQMAEKIQKVSPKLSRTEDVVSSDRPRRSGIPSLSSLQRAGYRATLPLPSIHDFVKPRHLEPAWTASQGHQLQKVIHLSGHLKKKTFF